MKNKKNLCIERVVPLKTTVAFVAASSVGEIRRHDTEESEHREIEKE